MNALLGQGLGFFLLLVVGFGIVLLVCPWGIQLRWRGSGRGVMGWRWQIRGGGLTVWGSGRRQGVVFGNWRQTWAPAPHWDFGRWMQREFPRATLVDLLARIQLVRRSLRGTTVRGYVQLDCPDPMQLATGLGILSGLPPEWGKSIRLTFGPAGIGGWLVITGWVRPIRVLVSWGILVFQLRLKPWLSRLNP